MRKPRQPRRLPMLGVLPRFLHEPLEVLEETAGEHGDLVYLGAAPRRIYLLNHPELVETVLTDDSGRFPKGAGIDRIRALLGNGLTTSDGALWRCQRRRMGPVFHPQATGQLAPIIARITGERVDCWLSQAGKPLDLLHEMVELTRRIIAEAVFGRLPEVELAPLRQAVGDAIEYADRYIWSAVVTSAAVPFTKRRRLQRARDHLDALISRQLRRRPPDNAGEKGMLHALQSESNLAFDGPAEERQFQDEIVTLFVAGHTTSAAALAWLWIIFSRHPRCRESVIAELCKLPQGEWPPPAETRNPGYLHAVIDETLRLYPPTWITARTANESCTLRNQRVPAGSILLISPYLLHRDDRFWMNPAQFDPERFVPSTVMPPSRFTYLPFGAGPRACIGRSLALFQIQLIASLVLRRCRIELLPRQRIEARARITLAPARPVLFTVTKVAE